MTGVSPAPVQTWHRTALLPTRLPRALVWRTTYVYLPVPHCLTWHRSRLLQCRALCESTALRADVNAAGLSPEWLQRGRLEFHSAPRGAKWHGISAATVYVVRDNSCRVLRT